MTQFLPQLQLAEPLMSERQIGAQGVRKVAERQRVDLSQSTSPPRAGFLLSGADTRFVQFAYRLPTNSTKQKTLLLIK